MTERRRHADARDHGADPVDLALDLLREDHRVELPDPALEARLRRRHRAAPTTRSWRRLAVAAAVLVIAGGAFAATDGVERIKTWWFRVVIDGAEERGEVTGDGERRFEFIADDGTRIQVQVTRRTETGATHTGIRVRQEGDGRVQLDEEQFHEGPREHERRDARSVADREPLHRWRDPARGELALHLVPDPDGGTELLVHERDSLDQRPVRVMGRVARALEEVRRVTIRESEYGEVLVTLGGGREFEYELLILPPGAAPPKPHFESPNGRVRVTVND